MYKNNLEKIIWEEISKALNDLGPNELKAVISSQMLAEVVKPAKALGKMYDVFKQRIKKYVSGGLMKRGEAQYFNDFIFPTPGPKVLPGEKIARSNSQSARAARARAQGTGPNSPDARAARAPDETIPLSNRRTARSRSAGTVDDYNAAWPTQPWGAEAVEQRIVQAGTRARTGTRVQFRQKGSIKNRELKNADNVIDDAFDDALEALAKGGDNAGDEAVNAFIKTLSRGVRATKSPTKTADEMLAQLGKSPAARSDLKKGLDSQVKRTQKRIKGIQKQVDALKDDIKGLEKRSDDILNLKKNANKTDKAKFDKELSALTKQKNQIAKRQGAREKALERSTKRLKKEQKEISRIDNMKDQAAGEAWIKQNVQKGLDDIDDAVRQGADDFRFNRTGSAPAGPAPQGARRARARARSRAQVDAAKVIERTPKNVKDALKPALEVAKKDPAALSKALQWVRTQSGTRIEQLRNNPRQILALSVGATTIPALIFSIFSDSTDDEGNGHKPASVEESRKVIEETSQEMINNLDKLSRGIENDKQIPDNIRRPLTQLQFEKPEDINDWLNKVKKALDVNEHEKIDTDNSIKLKDYAADNLPESLVSEFPENSKISNNKFVEVFKRWSRGRMKREN